MAPDTWDEEDDWRNPEWDEAWDEEDRDAPRPEDIADQEAIDETCPECGRALYGGAEMCPACGCWVRDARPATRDARLVVAVVLVGLMTVAGGVWCLL